MKEIQFKDFSWINILNPTEKELLEFSKIHQLNKYLIFDVLQDGHFPKFERLDNGYFIILRAYDCNLTNTFNTKKFTNKIAIFVLNNLIITIHKKKFSFLDECSINFDSKEKLLFYIYNKIVLSFEQPLLEQTNQINNFEKLIFTKDNKVLTTESLYYQKSKARIIKKLLLLTQQAINHIEVETRKQVYLSDIKDSLTSLIIFYDEILEDANSLLNSNLAIASQKNNQVMKLLTIFSAFFLPLTFIAGLYGMNFENMPELKFKNGYYYTLLFMSFVSIAVFIWFKRNKII